LHRAVGLFPSAEQRRRADAEVIDPFELMQRSGDTSS
jgi:hypothetical protein